MKSVKVILTVLILSMALFSCLDPTNPDDSVDTAAVVTAINAAFVSGAAAGAISKVFGILGKDGKVQTEGLDVTKPADVVGGKAYVINCKEYLGLSGPIFVTVYDGSFQEKNGFRILAPAIVYDTEDYTGLVSYNAQTSVKLGAGNLKDALKDCKIKLNFKPLIGDK